MIGDSDITSILSISQTMFDEKRAWNEFSQEVCENYYPVRASYTTSNPIGPDFANNVMDSHTINVREELGNAIGSMLRQGQWFDIGTGDTDRDEDIENARVLKHATKLFRSVLKDRRSGFESATKEGDHDWVSVGQPVFSVAENDSRDYVLVKAWHPGTCAWITGDTGRPTTLHRKITMRAGDIMRHVKSGRWTNVDLAIEIAATKEPTKKFEILHVMMSAEEVYGFDAQKMRDLRGKKYLSLYIDVTHKKVLQETGEPLFMYVTPAWRRLSGMNYGFSPSAINALPDSRMLQSLARIILEQGEKAVDPPMVGDVEAFTRDQNLYAGGFTYVDLPEGRALQDVMTTINTSQGLQQGMELKQDVRALITDAFLLNKLYLPSARDMRELEVAVRTEEFRRAALPFFTPIETEYHTPLLEEVFGRCMLMGIIDPNIFPQSLRGSDLHFTFNSPLNEAEGKKLVESYNLAVQTIAAGSQVDQTVGNLFNMRRATLDAVRGGGAPPEWLLSPKEVKQKDAEADQTKALTQAAAIANAGAGTISNVAQATMAAQQAGLVNPNAPQPPQQ